MKARSQLLAAPRVLVNGRDWCGCLVLPVVEAPAAVQRTLVRGEGRRVDVRATSLHAAPVWLALRWAVPEDGNLSQFEAGQKLGLILQHDPVARHHGRLPARSASAVRPQNQQLNAAQNSEGGRSVRLLVVVTDEVTGAPMQAAPLVC